MGMSPGRVAERVAGMIRLVRDGTSHSFNHNNAAEPLRYILQMHALGLIEGAQRAALESAICEALRRWHPMRGEGTLCKDEIGNVLKGIHVVRITSDQAMALARENIADMRGAASQILSERLHAEIVGYCRALFDTQLLDAEQWGVLRAEADEALRSWAHAEAIPVIGWQ